MRLRPTFESERLGGLDDLAGVSSFMAFNGRSRARVTSHILSHKTQIERRVKRRCYNGGLEKDINTALIGKSDRVDTISNPSNSMCG